MNFVSKSASFGRKQKQREGGWWRLETEGGAKMFFLFLFWEFYFVSIYIQLYTYTYIHIIEGSLNSNFRQYGELKSRDEKQMR